MGSTAERERHGRRDDDAPRHGGIGELHELLDRFETAMLVTVSKQGDLRARPMAIAAHDADPETLRFVTDRESAKVDEVLDQPRSVVTLAHGATFLSLTGDARIETPESEEIRSLWQPAWRLWFPDGPEASNIALLRFRIRFAEYWDRSGLNGFRFFWRATKALSEESELDDQRLPGHGKIDLGAGEPR